MGFMDSGFVRGIGDSLVNMLGGFGMPGRDKAASGGSFFVYQPMSRAEIMAAYRDNWMARKLIDIPAQDATRAWRAWQTDTNIIEALEDEEARLNLQVVLKKALIMSRLDGGAAIVLGVNQGRSEDPLDFERLKKGSLQWVKPVSRYSLGCGSLVRDVTDPNYGKPEFFTTSDVTIPDNGKAGVASSIGNGHRIHPSRVVVLQGMEVPDPFETGDIWGDSVLQIVRDAVQSATLVTQAVASLVTEAKIDVIKIPDLSQNIATTEYQNRLTARFVYANTAKSIINTLILDGEEEWDRKTSDFSQLPAILQMYLLIASGAADIPATRFLGQSPAGLQSTGDHDLRNYYDRVNSDQTNVLSPALASLDDVFIRSATGGRDPSLYYVWNSLWQLPEEVKSAVAKQKADAANLDAMMGLVDPEALRIGRQNQLIEDGTYPGLEQALEEQDQLDIASMQSPEEQQAQAEAEQRKQLMMGGAAGNQMPGQQGQQPGQQKKKPFGGGDAVPASSARRVKLGGRRRLTRDFNPDPAWIKGPDGKFEGSRPGQGGGEGGGSDDPYQLHGRTSALSPAVTHGRGVYRAADEPKARALQEKRTKLVAAIDRYKNHPTSQRVANLMAEHRDVMKGLRRLQLDPGGLSDFGRPGSHDVVIIGGGPAGLMAAANAAYEGMTVTLIEQRPKVGGQAEPSSGIKNALGTGPYGKTGEKLFSEVAELAQLNGAEIRTGTKAIAISYDADTGDKTVHLDNGDKITTPNVVLAAGVQLLTTKFAGSDGSGVYWGDGSGMTSFAGKGGTAVVVGGSNGAAQAAMGAANNGTKVVLLARSGLDKMSDEARKPLENNPNVTIITGTEIDRLERDERGKPTAVVTKDGQRFKADSVGMFVGQAPSTKWLPSQIATDSRGFVQADIDFKTTMPGVFAPGDVRANGPQRVQRSGGEGQTAVVEIYKYHVEQKKAAERGEAAPHVAAWVRHIAVPEKEQQRLVAEASEAASLREQLRETQRKLAAALGQPTGDADPEDKPGKMTLAEWDHAVDLLHQLDAEFPYILQCDEEPGDQDETHRAAGLRDFNQEHKGSGPGGGQFAPKGGGGVGGGGGATTQPGKTTTGSDPTSTEPVAKRTDITQNLGAEYDPQARQPVTDLEQLYKLSRKAEPAFQKTVEEFAQKFGGKVVYQPAETAEPGSRMKNRVSAERKVKGEYKGDASQIRDVLRATVVFDDTARTREAVADFVANNDVTRVKDRFMTPMGGYRDLMLNYRMPDGLITELQFNSTNLLEAKNGEGHKLYKATQELTRKSERSPDDDAIIAENIAKSEALYAAAYDADGDGCGWQRDC